MSSPRRRSPAADRTVRAPDDDGAVTRSAITSYAWVGVPGSRRASWPLLYLFAPGSRGTAR